MLSQAMTVQTTTKGPETTKAILQKDEGVSTWRHNEQVQSLQSIKTKVKGKRANFQSPKGFSQERT